MGSCVWGYTSLVHWVVRYSWTTSGCSVRPYSSCMEGSCFQPTHTKHKKNYRPQNKINTARRRRRRDNNLTNQLFFQLWSGLVIQKPWGCTRGCDAQALAQALKMRHTLRLVRGCTMGCAIPRNSIVVQPCTDECFTLLLVLGVVRGLCRYFF